MRRPLPWMVLALSVGLFLSCDSETGAPGEELPPPPEESGLAGTSGSTTSASACPATGTLPLERGDLADELRKLAIPSSGFVEPSGVELVGFERAFASLVAGYNEGAANELRALGFDVTAFVHKDGGPWLLVKDRQDRGGGTFAINLQPARDLWLEAPHADSDAGTLRQSAEAAVALGARALLITGVNRCGSDAATPCDGRSNMCGGTLRRADAAHYTNTFFQAAHRALRTVDADALAVNVHGMESQGVESAVISDGTRSDNAASLSLRLRDALNSRLPADRRAFSCNDPSQTGQYRPLCGTTNVQGRVDNGSTDACHAGSTVASGRFLHVEQSAELRPVQGPARYPTALSESLADVVPCTLAGNGLGCAQVAPVCQ